ncbi:MAG: T9SS type A sorting domain-containing protein [candidate division WOR-3 bacterium]
MAILLVSAVITVPGEPAQASEAEAVRLTEKAHTNMVAVAPPVMMTFSKDDLVMVERAPSCQDARLVAEIIGDDGSREYMPFAGAGWVWNEVYDPTYPHTDDGFDSWNEMKADGLGTLWAIYTGTTPTYTMDTIFVFCSVDSGNTWIYKLAIYSDLDTYDPWVARLSVDRVNNWVYISHILAKEAGGGNVWPGTVWVTRFQHLGGGDIANLGTYECDPQGWGDIYFKCAVACDGSGSEYVYLGGIDWINGYMDYYRSSDRGETWRYITSWSLGDYWTNVLSAAPRYGASGALIAWIDWDDVQRDFRYYWAEVTSAGETGHYFSPGGTGFRGLYGIAAIGNTWAAPFEEEAGPANFDTYFYYYDGSAYWLYTWDNTPADCRSPAMDATPENGGRYYQAFYKTSSGMSGRPYFCWAEVSDMSRWYTWPSCDYDVHDEDAITVQESVHWKFIDVAAQDTGVGGYLPHIAWRRTEGAEAGGDPWHSWPDPRVGQDESSGGSGLFAAFVGKGIAYSVPAETKAMLSVYDATGRTVSRIECTLSGRGVLELPSLNQGVYFFNLTTEGFGTRRGIFTLV